MRYIFQSTVFHNFHEVLLHEQVVMVCVILEKQSDVVCDIRVIKDELSSHTAEELLQVIELIYKLVVLDDLVQGRLESLAIVYEAHSFKL